MDVGVRQSYTDWLSLTQAKGIGPAVCKKLLLEFKNPKTILACDHQTLSGFGLSDASIRTLLAPDVEKINKILEWLNKPFRHLITIFDDDYPELLKSIHSPPIILFAVGQREVLGFLHFAIVGSRNPTAGGKRLAEDFAIELSKSALPYVAVWHWALITIVI